MSNIKSYKSNFKKGFSFMEVMIAVFVLSIGITAVLVLMAENIRYSVLSRDNIIASELAQEGIELVRNIRDNNFLTSSATPFEGIPPGVCTVDAGYPGGDCGGSHGTGFELYYSSSRIYTHEDSGNVRTKFSRSITVSRYFDGGGSEVGRKIISRVWWDGRTSPPADCKMETRCVSVEDVLTDWTN